MTLVHRTCFVAFLGGLFLAGVSTLRSQETSGKGTVLTNRAGRALAEEQQLSVGELHTSASRIYTHVFKKTSLGHEHGIEGRIQGGRLALGATHDAGRILFDMSSFDADTLNARKYLGLKGATEESTRKEVNENMRGPLVLHVEKYPTAVFEIDSALLLKDQATRALPQYRLAGKFTLCGKTQPLAVTVDAEEQRGWTHLRGSFRIQQSNFGMTPFSKAFGMIGVADELAIHADVWVAGSPQGLARRQKDTP